MRFKIRRNIKFIIAMAIVITVSPSIFDFVGFGRSGSNSIDAIEDQHIEYMPYMDRGMTSRGTVRTRTAMDMVRATYIFAKIAEDSPYYDSHSMNKEQIGSFSKDQVVEVIKDRGRESYLVKAGDGSEGWIPAENLIIPDDPETNAEWMSKRQVEEFINNSELTSQTSQLIWVDIDRQLTHVLLNEDDTWKHYRTMLSATGANKSPTVKGVFEIQERGEEFYSDRLKSGAKNWVRFDGPYLFHSLSMDKDGNITDYTLGKRASDGCIRLSMEDSKWFYDNIEEGSTVFIN